MQYDLVSTFFTSKQQQLFHNALKGTHIMKHENLAPSSEHLFLPVLNIRSRQSVLMALRNQMEKKVVN